MMWFCLSLVIIRRVGRRFRIK
uniref:Uncharacterized protein n=1 Tax=Arundo donax TaxID=35708 RepID=A0A0A8XZZ9_ARUDO